jgi:hypothetical protein
MSEADQEWFETIQIGDRHLRHVSKFIRKDFSVPKEILEERWRTWNWEDRLKFAGAFSARAELGDNDQRLLDFLMDNGNPEIWSTIALSVARHHDHNRALSFLLARVKEAAGPLANYYQALEMLADPACVPGLRTALQEHRRQVALHPVLQSWSDRFFYLDYLSCSATLLKITGQAEYRANLEEMSQHSDESIRKMVRMVASSSNIVVG